MINVLMPANCQVLFMMIVKVATFDIIPVDGIMAAIDKAIPTEDGYEMPQNF